MCRLLGWLGAPRSLAEVLLEPPHSLLVQSYAAQRMRSGVVNADGWGVAWWPTPGAEPARWRSARPIWQDAAQSLGSVAPHVHASAFVASVRDASPGMPLDETATAPFVRGPWALTHNGVVDRSAVPPGVFAPESVCDSAVLAAWLLDDPLDLGSRIARVGAADPGARLTVLVSDGTQLLATAWGNSLCWRQGDGTVELASEATDSEAGWQDVPDHSLVHVAGTTVTITSLETP